MPTRLEAPPGERFLPSEPSRSETVLVYWEEGYDDWFAAEVDDVDPEKGTATLYYPETDETEENSDLRELVKQGWLKLRETITVIEEVRSDVSFSPRCGLEFSVPELARLSRAGAREAWQVQVDPRRVRVRRGGRRHEEHGRPQLG